MRIITNKLIANIIFGAVLVGGAAISGVAAKQLVTSSGQVTDTLKNDVTTITFSKKESDSQTPKNGNSGSVNSNTNTNSCIILVNGKKYDVEPLRSTHRGGDIFVCGTDMTSQFKSQHGMDFQRLSKYLVSDSTSLSSSNPSKSVVNTSNGDDNGEYEREDEKEDEREVEHENEREDENEYEYEFEN